MFTCILCRTEFQDEQRTKEHVFPDALGGTVILNDLCKGCNSHLGSYVDSPLVNNWLMASRRYLYKLPGKSGRIPHFTEGATVLTNEEGHKVQYRYQNGRWRLYTLPRVTTTFENDDELIYQIALDKQDEGKLPEILNRLSSRHRKQLRPAKWKQYQLQRVVTENPRIQMRFKFDMISWKRGMLKIAYELTYLACGPTYLDDPASEAFRELLRWREVTSERMSSVNIPGRIDLWREGQMALSDLGKPDQLLGAVIRTGPQIGVYVNLFNVFEALVQTSTSAGRYDTQILDRVYQINARTGARTVTPFLEWINSLDTAQD